MSYENQSSVSMDNIMKAVAFLENGESIEDVAEIFETSVAVVQSWFDGMKTKNLSKPELTRREQIINNSVTSTRSEQSYKNDSPIHSKSSKRDKGIHSQISLEDKLIAIELYKEGSTLSEVALQYGTSAASVSYWLKKETVLKEKLKKLQVTNKIDFQDARERNTTKSKTSPTNDNVSIERRQRLKRPIVEEHCSKTEEMNNSTSNKMPKIDHSSRNVKNGENIHDESLSFRDNVTVEGRKRLKRPIGEEYRSKTEAKDYSTNNEKSKIVHSSSNLKNGENIHDKNSDLDCEDFYKNFLLKEYENVKEIYERYIAMSTNLLEMKRNYHDQSSNNRLNDHMSFMRSEYFQSISKRYFEMEQMFLNK